MYSTQEVVDSSQTHLQLIDDGVHEGRLLAMVQSALLDQEVYWLIQIKSVVL